MDDARGADVDQGSLMRYLNEIMWFPTAFLGDNITWEAIDDDSARVTLTDRGESVSAVLTFDEEGRLANFVGERYYHAGTPESVLLTWSTPITSYGEFEGLRLPAGGHGVWHLDSGEFTYIELEITDIQLQCCSALSCGAWWHRCGVFKCQLPAATMLCGLGRRAADSRASLPGRGLRLQPARCPTSGRLVSCCDSHDNLAGGKWVIHFPPAR
jgi:hypothetical protein